MKFKAAIFDLDGTLLDSMQVWEKIDADFLGRRGIAVPHDYAAAIKALGFKQAAVYTKQRFNLPESVEEIGSEWNEMAAQEYAENIRLKKGAAEYLRLLKASGVKLASATSLDPFLFEPVLKNNGILHLFDAACFSNEVKRDKEHPDIFLLAAQRLGVKAEHCIVYEDILPAVLSAKKAGMRVCAVYDAASENEWPQIKAEAHEVIFDFYEAPLMAY